MSIGAPDIPVAPLSGASLNNPTRTTLLLRAVSPMLAHAFRIFMDSVLERLLVLLFGYIVARLLG